MAENLLLRQQVIVLRRRRTRPRLRAFDRWLIGTLSGRFRELLDAVIVVKPYPSGLRRVPRSPSPRSRCRSGLGEAQHIFALARV
jgi:hypothetical protein